MIRAAHSADRQRERQREGLDLQRGGPAGDLHGQLDGEESERLQEHRDPGADPAAGRHQREHRLVHVHEFTERGGVHEPVAQERERGHTALGTALLRTQQWAYAQGGSGYYGDLSRTEQIFGDPAMPVFARPHGFDADGYRRHFADGQQQRTGRFCVGSSNWVRE